MPSAASDMYAFGVVVLNVLGPTPFDVVFLAKFITGVRSTSVELQWTASACFGKQPQGPGSVRGSDAGSVASGRPSARQSAYNSAAASTRQSAYNSAAASQQQPTSCLQEA
jgi:hypothetical protein